MTAEPTDGTLAGNYHDAKDEWSPAYLGGYLNWGYWRDVPDRPEYTPADRVHASAELYRLVLRAAGARPGDVVLEVGCGTGTGAIEMSREFQPAEMHGVDKLESQLTAARQACAQVAANDRGELFFQTATADDLPYPANRFDVVISVEALQHFPEAGGFAREASRVLKPGGRLAVTTFFPSAGAGFGDLTELLWSYRTGFDVATTVDDLTAELAAAGFTGISTSCIGEHVWTGLDKWIAANGYKHHWGRNFIVAYRRGLIDYHLVTAIKPG
jgi:MPBQ/MSBQ methyltransferase